METTAEQLIRDKSFDALSQEELLVVQELCDSEGLHCVSKQHDTETLEC